MKDCRIKKIKCPLGCGQMIGSNHSLKEHVKVCPKWMTSCQFCDEVMERQHLIAHQTPMHLLEKMKWDRVDMIHKVVVANLFMQCF